MNILQLEVSNFRKHKLTAVEFPASGVAQFLGIEDAGKTTLLKAIKACLSPKLIEDKGTVIQDGETRADVILKVGDPVTGELQYTIQRIIRTGDPKNWKLKITRGDGSKVENSPQALLDTFFNDIAIDPMDYLRLKGQDLVDKTLQATTFQTDEKYTSLIQDAARVVQQEVQEAGKRKVKDLEEYTPLELLDKAEKVAFDRRQNVNRDLKGVEAQLTEYQGIDTNIQEIDTTQITQQRNELFNQKQQRATTEQQLGMIMQQIADVNAQMRQLDAKLEELTKQQEATTTQLNSMPPVDDAQIDILDAQLQNAANVEKARIAKKLQDQHAGLIKEAQQHDQRVQDVRQYKKNLASTAQFPLEGMGYDAEQNVITYQGKPLESWGFTRNLIAAAAVGYSLNSKLKFILLDQGGEFSQDAVRDLAKWAQERDLLVIMVRKEKVEGEGVAWFEIVDGKVEDQSND